MGFRKLIVGSISGSHGEVLQLSDGLRLEVLSAEMNTKLA